ncbi:uncharacterized protein [Physcomitrium patens]
MQQTKTVPHRWTSEVTNAVDYRVGVAPTSRSRVKKSSSREYNNQAPSSSSSFLAFLLLRAESLLSLNAPCSHEISPVVTRGCEARHLYLVCNSRWVCAYDEVV